MSPPTAPPPHTATAPPPAESSPILPRVSVIVPTLREAENLAALAERLHAAMGTEPYELVIVDDDSRDGTEEVCQRLAERFPVRLLVRRPPRDGLSGAVLAGFDMARGDVLVVMDADLQHPPEQVPDLVAAVRSGAAFALGSRYMHGGRIEGRWSPFRRLNSHVATLLARPFASGITDPMSGFFALPRSTLRQARRLTPLGYKIALELLCKCRVNELPGGLVERPITFGQRHRGHSKLTFREQFRYLEHLSRLYDFTFPRASPAAKFLVAVLLGALAASAVFFLLPAEGLHPRTRMLLSYPAAIAVTALLHYRYVNAQHEFIVRRRPWLDFWAISAAELVTAVAAAGYLAWRVPQPSAWELLLLPLLLATVVRYVLRKELLLDVRGLRRDVRLDELGPPR
ncbi:MAG: polyprenol monophosphomannose synthase [Tepidisphaerales bacterium]